MHENDPPRLVICDANAARLAAVAGRLGVASVEPCADPGALREFLTGRDAVWIADPCPSRGEVESLVAVARRAGRQLAVVNPDRHLPSRRLVREQLGGPLGEAGLVRVHRWEPHTGRPADLPDPLLRDIDVTVWLAGRRPDRVFAVEQQPDDSSPGRYFQVHLGFAGGAMALLDYSSRLPAGDGYQSLSVIAARGAAHADDHQNMQLLYRGGNAQAVRTEEHAAHVAAAVREFVAAVRAGRDVMTENAAGWQNLFAVADAVQKSLVSGEAVGLEGR